MNYVYRQSEPGLWTVGFYDPNSKWQPESDWDSREDAAKRVHYLNGGIDPSVANKERREMAQDLIDILLVLDDNVEEARSMLNYLIGQLRVKK